MRLRATLLKPKDAGRNAAWLFVRLPKAASRRLPSRGPVAVEGTIGAAPFVATLQPDGEGGHWLKVDAALRRRAGIEPGESVALEITPLPPGQEPEPDVPPDLRRALAASPKKAREAWANITPAARRDWVQWATSGKRADTRPSRIAKACDMLASGKRRPCCFDRSGMYDKSQSCPAAEGSR